MNGYVYSVFGRKKQSIKYGYTYAKNIGYLIKFECKDNKIKRKNVIDEVKFTDRLLCIHVVQKHRVFTTLYIVS